MNVFENLFICADEPQEKVGIVAFDSLVVDYTKYLTWMPVLAPSMLFRLYETCIRSEGRRHTDAFKVKLKGR